MLVRKDSLEHTYQGERLAGHAQNNTVATLERELFIFYKETEMAFACMSNVASRTAEESRSRDSGRKITIWSMEGNVVDNQPSNLK